VRRWRLIVTLPLLLIAGARPPIPPPTTNPGTWFVEVEGEGGYWLGPESLRAMGVDPMAQALPSVRLSWSDEKMAHLPLRTNRGWGLFFFAADRSTRYTRRTAIRLETGLDGSPMNTEALPVTGHAAETALTTLHWEENHRYLPQADTDIPWMWERLNTPDSVAHTLALPDGVSGPISVTLRVWSHTSSQANPDHLLRLKWDGQMVGEWKWDGQGMQHLTTSWDESLPDNEHTLEIETPVLPDVRMATVWVDGWDMTLRQRVRANGTIWQAEGTALRVEAATAESRILDVTDPSTPRDLGSIPADGVAATVPGHRYWIGDPTRAPEPPNVRPARRVDTDTLEDTTYLAVAPLEFHAALQPLLDHRRGQGLKAEVVDVKAVYDAFGDGCPDPGAIRALVQHLPGLRYLLLVGDGTAEPGGYDGLHGEQRVVTPLVRTFVLGETPADVLLGVDEEEQPIVAVGRFPAASAREVRAMVDKTLQWEEATSSPTALILSDNELQFTSVADGIADHLPEGVTVLRLDAGDRESRAEALRALREGPTWVNYAGHGSLTLLCNEGTLVLEDGETWRDPAVMVAWTCLAGHFIHPEQESIGEAWMRLPQGGVAAFLGPVGETTTGEQLPFAMTFYATLREEGQIGNAWLAAIQKEGSQDVMWGYSILGDPALRMYGE
jgi:hypothetical protein